MSQHGHIVANDSKLFRVICDDEGNQLRVLLYEDIYDRLKPLYDHLEWISAGVGVQVPERVEASLEWLASLSIEIGAYGWVFTIGITGWIIHLAKNRVSLGKFTYEPIGRLSSSRLGSAPLGGGTRILELPVEG